VHLCFFALILTFFLVQVYDFLDAIKIDDTLGFYMRRLFYRFKREDASKVLTTLNKLVDGAEEKPKEKKGEKKQGKKKNEAKH
jgi:hypothetical protein